MSRTLGIIPARYLSTRFPGKPLVDIAGKSMICRVYEQCSKATGLHAVYVATDDQRIFKEVTSHGGKAIMTDSAALNGTARCLDAFDRITEKEGSFDFLINIQGDEPFIHPEQVTELAALIKSGDCPIATLAKEISDPHDLTDDNVVKVVLDNHSRALYFSRQTIPYLQGTEKNQWLSKFKYLKHIGIYAFNTSILPEIRSFEPSAAEKAESLERLRWLSNGLKIKVGVTRFNTIAVDTPADLEKAISFIQSHH